MDDSFHTVTSQLGYDKRYVSPRCTRFWHLDGPYHCEHRFDKVLNREVELYTERIDFAKEYTWREKFIREAKLGGLHHPHLVPVFDLGLNGEGLLYFTRPFIPGMDLFEVIHNCLGLDFWRVLRDSIDMASFPRHVADSMEEFFESRRSRAQWFVDHGFMRWTTTPAAPPRLSLPADAGKLYAAIERYQANYKQWESEEAKQGSPADEEESINRSNVRYERDRIAKACGAARWDLAKKILDHNGVTKRELAKHQRGVKFNLSRFAEVVIDACSAIDFSHRQGVFHMVLSPRSILIGEEGGAVYVKEWRDAYVRGESMRSLYSISASDGTKISGMGETTIFKWSCVSPEFYSLADPDVERVEPNPTINVFALGGILSFILHDAPPQSLDRKPVRFREAVVPNSEPPWSDTREFATELAEICDWAQRRDPEERYPRASDLAADLQRCLEKRRSTGLASREG